MRFIHQNSLMALWVIIGYLNLIASETSCKVAFISNDELYITTYRTAGNIGVELYLAVGEKKPCRQISIRQYNFIIKYDPKIYGFRNECA